jgi:hypothetical protein
MPAAGAVVPQEPSNRMNWNNVLQFRPSKEIDPSWTLSGDSLRSPRRFGNPRIAMGRQEVSEIQPACDGVDLYVKPQYSRMPSRPIPTRGTPQRQGCPRGCISPRMEHPSGCDGRANPQERPRIPGIFPESPDRSRGTHFVRPRRFGNPRVAIACQKVGEVMRDVSSEKRNPESEWEK